MPDQARITSVEALESFRASLILFVSKARPTLEEVTSDVLRTRLWLEDDQRNYWMAQIRRRNKKLEEAKETLYRASLSNLRKPTMAEQVAVRKARQAVEEAEDKLKRVRKWSRDFDSRVEPMSRNLEKLHTVLSNVLPDAIAYLGNTVKTLEIYGGKVRSPGPPTEVPPEGEITADAAGTVEPADSGAAATSGGGA